MGVVTGTECSMFCVSLDGLCSSDQGFCCDEVGLSHVAVPPHNLAAMPVQHKRLSDCCSAYTCTLAVSRLSAQMPALLLAFPGPTRSPLHPFQATAPH